MSNHQLNHLAIIMDGNARWAEENNKLKSEGHKKGAEVAKKLVPVASELGIKYLTLYAFSSENWNRPNEEVSILINLLGHYLKNETKTLDKKGVRLKVIGNLEKLSEDLQKQISEAVEKTKNNLKMTVAVAFSYGSRSEIVDAYQKIIKSKLSKITESDFKKFLYDPQIPDVDMIIRTSGTYRMSNFLLWQAAYAELYFSDKFWPDFNEEDLRCAIIDFSKRNRNFGSR